MEYYENRNALNSFFVWYCHQNNSSKYMFEDLLTTCCKLYELIDLWVETKYC